MIFKNKFMFEETEIPRILSSFLPSSVLIRTQNSPHKTPSLIRVPTQVLVPAPTLRSSQLPVPPVPGDPNPLLASMSVCTQVVYTQIHINNNEIKSRCKLLVSSLNDVDSYQVPHPPSLGHWNVRFLYLECFPPYPSLRLAFFFIRVPYLKP